MKTHDVRGVPRPSVNALAAPLVEALVDEAEVLRLRVTRADCGARLVDAGAACRGSLEAGRRIAEICLGGVGSVRLRASDSNPQWLSYVDVSSSRPVLACLGSQYAGWSLSQGSGKDAFQALGSGPARAIGSKESLFDELGYRDQSQPAVLVLETEQTPPDALLESIAEDCGIPPRDLTVILTPTCSVAGVVQVISRVLEVALHKTHELEFPLDQVADGLATAPICPPGGDFLTAMGRTNDAIIYGGRVHLMVEADAEAAADLAQRLPSVGSKDFGRPFAELFKEVEYDFYKIDHSLFSPAEAFVTCLGTGQTIKGGGLQPELLQQSFKVQ